MSIETRTERPGYDLNRSIGNRQMWSASAQTGRFSNSVSRFSNVLGNTAYRIQRRCNLNREPKMAKIGDCRIVWAPANRAEPRRIGQSIWRKG